MIISKINEVEINGEVYVKKGSETTKVPDFEGLTLCVLRTYSAGVWIGWVDYESGEFGNVTVIKGVRVYKWSGAFTLSELAVVGTTDPKNCKFSTEVPELKLNKVIEYLPICSSAVASLNKVAGVSI